MPDDYHEFHIYFNDLNEDAQKRMLDAVGVKTAAEMNWDISIVPIATYCFCKEDDENESN